MTNFFFILILLIEIFKTFEVNYFDFRSLIISEVNMKTLLFSNKNCNLILNIFNIIIVLTKDFALNFWIGTSVDRFDNRNLIQINHNNLKLTLLLTYVEEINFDNNYQSVFIQFEEMELPLDSIDYVTKNGKSYFLEKVFLFLFFLL